MWFKVLPDGKVVICSTNQTKTYQDIFKAIDGLYFALNNLMQKEGRTKKTEAILTLLADIIKVKNWDREEIKNAILFLEDALLKSEKASEIDAFVKRAFICLRKVKTIPKIAAINRNYYSPENSDLTVTKIRIQNLKKELENYLDAFRNEKLTEQLEKQKNIQNENQKNVIKDKIKPLKTDTFLVQTKNIKGEDLYLIVHINNNKFVITSRFVLKEKLDYQDLEIIPEEEALIQKAIEAIIEK